MTEDVLGVLFEGEVLPENAQTAEQQHANPAERRINRLTAEKYRERARAKQCSGSQSRASGGANSY